VLLSGIPILSELYKAGRETLRTRGNGPVPVAELPEDLREHER
jgi:membrane-associated protein